MPPAAGEGRGAGVGGDTGGFITTGAVDAAGGGALDETASGGALDETAGGGALATGSALGSADGGLP